MTAVHRKSILVACCGQAMAGDDAFGLHVAQALHTLKLPNTKIVTLATKTADLLDHLPEPPMLIIVDAARDPSGRIGQLVDLDWFDPDRPPLTHETILSTHGLSIADQIELAQRLGICPPLVWLVACTVSDVGVGQAMHPAVCQQVPLAAHRVEMITKRCAQKPLGAGSGQ